MVFDDLNESQLQTIVLEMQGLKNYIEMERYQQMTDLNQYCIQQKYINILDNESDDERSVGSSIFRSNLATSAVVQQYPRLDDNGEHKMIDENEEFKSDKADTNRHNQTINDILKESEDGQNLLMLQECMVELKRLRSKEYLLANNYSLFTEQNGVQIYNKLENSVNYIVSNGVMRYERQ